MELAPVLVLSVSVVAHAILVGRAAAKATTDLKTAVLELTAGIYERGERPESDYVLFDEELSRIHLEQGEDINFGGELALEYDPLDVEV